MKGSRASMKSIMRSLRTELRFQVWSRILLVVLLVATLIVGVSFIAVVNSIGATYDKFLLTKS